MNTRALIWLVAVLAVALIVVPVIGMFGMMSMHWMTGSGGMLMGMSLAGLLWMLGAIVVVIALATRLIREATKTP